jgi:methylated-DNA-[protein]-cysteine S-methyltransferase
MSLNHSMSPHYYATMDTPLGPLLLWGREGALAGVNFQAGTQAREPAADWVADARPLADALAQLRAYFAGQRRDFSLAVEPQGTPFQRHVWQTLREIPYGVTITYGELARRVGKPSAARAVGAANGQNPIPIIIPCHRVIGANGKLTGFAGGLHLKEGLLALEQALPAEAGGQARLI